MTVGKPRDILTATKSFAPRSTCSHTSSAIYLYFGLHGHSGLVPWIWSSIALTAFATLVLFLPRTREDPRLLVGACVALFAAIWIEKGMGLIIPGFIPSTLHEVVEYAPSLVEWQITAGVWAFGLMVFTIALKFLLGWSTAAGAAALCLTMLFFSLGPGPLTFVVVNEIVPLPARGKLVALSVFFNRLGSGHLSRSKWTPTLPVKGAPSALLASLEAPRSPR